jgi:hypothetical protein
MKKYFEYNEPEFTVVKTAQQDVLTISGGIIGTITGDWDTGGDNGGDIGFGL